MKWKKSKMQITKTELRRDRNSGIGKCKLS